ncbi:MAG: phasin family protein [Thermodesulfobacteriota bacterium]
MIELVKKTLLTGVGVAVLSKEKIEELARELIEKGKMSEEEGKTFVDDLLKRSEESRETLQKQIEEKVRAVLEKMDLAQKSEIEALRHEIEELRKQVESS